MKISTKSLIVTQLLRKKYVKNTKITQVYLSHIIIHFNAGANLSVWSTEVLIKDLIDWDKS